MDDRLTNKEEQELIGKFRLLSPSSRSTVMTAIAEAVFNEGMEAGTSTCSQITQTAEGNEISAETN